MARVGHGRQPGLDVAAPVQVCQAPHTGVNLGQEPTELGEVASPGGHGLGGVGADKPLEVGDKSRLEPIGAPTIRRPQFWRAAPRWLGASARTPRW